MHLIIGLGNPEKNYKGTRHNMGFEVVNKLSSDHKIGFNRAKFKAHIGEGTICGLKVMLVKPQTFMNLSGESVLAMLKFYKLEPKDIVVIYDDVSLELGQIRIRERGSAGGQNGMKNIISLLETDEFLRIRVGVGEKPSNMDLADYVTSRFKPNEIEQAQMGVDYAAQAVETYLKSGIKDAMNKFNKKIIATETQVSK